MSASRLRLRLLLPFGLVLLVFVLGALQYRWLGQVSEAEREQLQRSLNQRAREFADRFDQEIGFAYARLGVTQNELQETAFWTSLDTKLERWKADAPHADIIKAVYVTRPADDAAPRTLEQLAVGSGTGTLVAWPDRLQPVLQALDRVPARPANVPPTAQLLSLSRTSVIESVPALIIPVTQFPQRMSPSGGMIVAIRSSAGAAVIVELDRDVLTTRLLPELVEHVFPLHDTAQYHIAIRGDGPEPLYLRGASDPASVTPANADAMAAFFSTPHLEMAARAMTEGQFFSWQLTTSGSQSLRTGTTVASRTVDPASGNVSIVVQERSSAPAAGVDALMTAAMGGWQIAVRHGAGSLDAAVTDARHRNLLISFSILSVLAIGVGLIVVNARRAEKLAAQQMDFVATVSHELRTPLAVIRSAAQNLSAGVVDEPGRARQYGTLIEAEGRRLTDMVEEVLEFAGMSGQRRALALKAVDVTALVREVVAASSHLIDAAHIQVNVTVDDDVPLVNGDEDALRRAVSNLLANALKHGADGRWVGVRVARHREPARDEVHITVSDRGRGLDEGDQTKVFEPFYRGRHALEQQIQGYGLGLSLVQRIAEAHGGKVAVASSPGQGAAFTLQLPVPAELAGV